MPTIFHSMLLLLLLLLLYVVVTVTLPALTPHLHCRVLCMHSPHSIPRKFNVSLLQGSRNEHAIHSSKAIGEPPLNLGLSVALALGDAINAARHEIGIAQPFGFDQLPATVARVHVACGASQQLHSKQ
jgi:xanthine dehydrogenase molybdopterin-binding subunit B